MRKVGEGTWDSRDWVKGRAADAKDLVLSARSCSEPITSLGLMMSQSSITGPAVEQKAVDLTMSLYYTPYLKDRVAVLQVCLQDSGTLIQVFFLFMLDIKVMRVLVLCKTCRSHEASVGQIR